MTDELRKQLLDAIGKLEAREWPRDTADKPLVIIGAHWVNRNEVVELIQKWHASSGAN